MSPRTPRLTANEVITHLKKNGFLKVTQKGSHLKLFHPTTRKIAIVPIHSNQILPIGTLKSIEKQSGLEF